MPTRKQRPIFSLSYNSPIPRHQSWQRLEQEQRERREKKTINPGQRAAANRPSAPCGARLPKSGREILKGGAIKRPRGYRRTQAALDARCLLLCISTGGVAPGGAASMIVGGPLSLTLTHTHAHTHTHTLSLSVSHSLVHSLLKTASVSPRCLREPQTQSTCPYPSRHCRSHCRSRIAFPSACPFADSARPRGTFRHPPGP